MTIDMSYYRTINGLLGTVDKKDFIQKQAIKSVNKTNDSMISTFEILINSNYAEDIIVDGISAKGIFDYSKSTQDTKTKTELSAYMKELWIEVGLSDIGSIVKHTDKVSQIENSYIILSKQEDIDGYDVCYIQKSTNTLFFYPTNPNENQLLSGLIEIPCIVGDKVNIKTDESKYMTTVSNELFLTIPHTDITEREVKINNIYKIGLHSYKIESFPDDVYIHGLLVFLLSYSEVEQVFPIFTLEILNGASIQVNENDPLTINAQVKIDGIISPSMPSLLFSSSDITKATISNTGVVTILNVGNVAFSCRMENDLSVMDTISVEIVSVPNDNFLALVSGSPSITKNYTSTYICSFRNNGIVLNNIVSEFYLTADDGINSTSLASIISQDGLVNNCILKGLNLGYVRLFARSLDGTIVSDGFRVQIKSLF